MDVNWQEAKGIIQSRYPIRSLLRPSRYGQWCCPVCGSGDGPHGTGAVKLYESENAVDCFGRCASAAGKKARRYDVIDIYMAVHGCGFAQAVQSMSAELGLNLVKSAQTATDQETPASCRALYDEAADILLHRPAGQPGRDYLAGRHIDLQAAERYHAGFMPGIDILGNGHPAPRLIIPMSDSGYVGIDIRPESSRYRRMINRGGKVCPSGLQFLWDEETGHYIYVCEGWADALSIMSAGRYAVALNSAGNWRMLADALRDKPAEKTLLLCLDADEAGQRAQQDLAAELAKLHVSFSHVTATVCGAYKDPNEALCAEPDLFPGSLERAEMQSAPRPDAVDTYIKGDWFAADIAAAQGRVPTGFANFDAASGGLYSGLYVVGAITGLGKTTWALQVANSIARSGTHVIYFSLEMSRLEIVCKSLASRYAADGGMQEITSLGIRQGGYFLKEIMESGTLDAYASDTAPQMSIVEGGMSCSTDYLCDYVQNYKSQNQVKPVVIVDYLQILEPGRHESRYQSTRESVDASVKALKKLSRELAIPVIVISSLNRSNYMMPISEESFKESGGIEYSADCILGLELDLIRSAEFDQMSITAKREAVRAESNKNPRKISLVCIKNRFGRKGWECRYDYYPACDYFLETTDMSIGNLPVAGRRGTNGQKKKT